MPQRKARGATLRRFRESLKLRPQGMAISLSMTRDSYVNLEAGRRHLYASDLVRLHLSHGITPNDILLSTEDHGKFAELAGLTPPDAAGRAMVARYLQLPPHLRQVIDQLASALHRADQKVGLPDDY